MSHNCNYCHTKCIRKGVRNTVQKYYCKSCRKYQQQKYTYKKLTSKVKENIIRLIVEGCSISSVARYLSISKSAVQREIIKLGNEIERPIFKECHEEYELDEMSLKVGGMDDVFLIYAINRETRNVIDFFIGGRTKENLRKVVNTVLEYKPVKIFTDRLNSYPSLIPKEVHRPGRRLTNRIERKNLTLRNFIKRLSRCTLCFTRNITMLESCLRIYLWRKTKYLHL